jgi:hypothetical protein
MSSSAGNTPTPRQLRFLRALAEQTGTTFATPETRGAASAEIDRLIAVRDGVQVLPFDECERAENALQVDGSDERDEQLVYATAVQAGEVSGFGSSASWRTSSPAVPAVVEEPRIGDLVELQRYRVPGGERVLYGQRINGCVRITDRPASGRGRSYLVERELEQDGFGALKALVADYLQQAAEMDDVPMASGLVRRELEQMRA